MGDIGDIARGDRCATDTTGEDSGDAKTELGEATGLRAMGVWKTVTLDATAASGLTGVGRRRTVNTKKNRQIAIYIDFLDVHPPKKNRWDFGVS